MKKIIVWIILLCCILGGLYLVRQRQYHSTTEYKLLKKGYTKEQLNTLKKHLTEDQLTTLLKLNTEEEIVNLVEEKDFNFNHLERYLSYQEPKNKSEKIRLVNADIDKLDIPYHENMIKFMDATYYIQDHMKRYIAYQEKHIEQSIDEIITNVNSNLDDDYYTNIKDTDLSKKNLIIVNKYYKLDQNYIPDHLVSIDNAGHQATKETADHFKEMITAAQKEKGYTFKVNSAYRSYNTQDSLYNRYKNQHGLAWAESYSARPGHSEHQTGLAIDMVASSSTFDNFEDTKEYQWLIDHAHNYGFILRYPKGKEHITGYHYESWHYRYVGKEIATKIHDLDLTYEEYYAYFIK